MSKIKLNNYSFLIEEIGKIISNNKKKVISSINTILTETYWNIGKYIVEYEQNGNERAQYGKGLLKNLSKDLNNKFGKGYSERNLKYARNFYIFFKNIDYKKRQSLIAKLSWTHIVRLLSVREKNIFTKEYNLYLPNKEDFKKQLESLSLIGLNHE